MARIALFRADASSRIGSGHVRRCLAIAAELRRAGWRCRFAVGEASLIVVPELTRGEFEVRALAPAARFDPAALARSAPDGCDLLVTDHYEIARDYERAAGARQTLVIDDLADRPHACDALVDATPGRTPAAYRGLVPEGAALLLGGAYAPLRPAFAGARERRRERVASRRLYVNFGGTDPDDATGRVLDALSVAGRPERLEADVVVGRGAVHTAAVAEQAKRMAFVRLHLDPPEPASIMESCDLAVGAGGVSALERCTMGLPSLLVVIADNQRLVAEGVARGGGGVLAPTPEEAVRMALELLAEPAALARMGRAAMALCDGRGAQRSALWVDPGAAKDGRTVRLRPAAPEDEARTLAWQRQPQTRRFARDPRAPTEDAHRAWLAARLADPDCLFNIVLHGGEPAGVARLDRRDQGYEVSIHVDAARHGRKIGGAALGLVRRLVPEAPLLAQVKGENTASRALFASAGYRSEGAWLVHRRGSP